MRAALLALPLLLAGCASLPAAQVLDEQGAALAAGRLERDFAADGELASWSVTSGTTARGPPLATHLAAVRLDDAGGYLLTAKFLPIPAAGGEAMAHLTLHVSCTPTHLTLNATGPREAAELGGFSARAHNRSGSCPTRAPPDLHEVTRGLGLASAPVHGAATAPFLLRPGNWTLLGTEGDRARYQAPAGPAAHGFGAWSVDARVEGGRIVELEATAAAPEGELPARDLRVSARFWYGERGPPEPAPPAHRTPWNGTR